MSVTCKEGLDIEFHTKKDMFDRRTKFGKQWTQNFIYKKSGTVFFSLMKGWCTVQDFDYHAIVELPDNRYELAGAPKFLHDLPEAISANCVR